MPTDAPRPRPGPRPRPRPDGAPAEGPTPAPSPSPSPAPAPQRSKALLEQWVQEFRDQGHRVAGELSVALQDGSEGDDTGLVIVHLRNEYADILMQPAGPDEPLWEATVTARTQDLALSPYQLASLAAEFVVAGNLCSFLQFKSLDEDRASGTRGRLRT